MKGSVSLMISLKSFEVSFFTIKSFRTELWSLKWFGGSLNSFFFGFSGFKFRVAFACCLMELFGFRVSRTVFRML
jgi:hypothetical protein